MRNLQVVNQNKGEIGEMTRKLAMSSPRLFLVRKAGSCP